MALVSRALVTGTSSQDELLTAHNHCGLLRAVATLTTPSNQSAYKSTAPQGTESAAPCTPLLFQNMGVPVLGRACPPACKRHLSHSPRFPQPRPSPCRGGFGGKVVEEGGTGGYRLVFAAQSKLHTASPARPSSATWRRVQL
ncbi:unnamed protein product [Schistocephalus solidus]|uniref:Uncharacterized protein n=1 Tax=Schistocephalus solidus TaxID=70667 RepID=A0A183S851_SCHSO|nr:unnamed protein product [Schistocephalus solidus]